MEAVVFERIGEPLVLRDVAPPVPGNGEVVVDVVAGRVLSYAGEVFNQAAMRAAVPGPIDCVLDLMPPSAPVAAVRAAVMTVRPNGRVILMGGVGSEGGEDLGLPYPWLMRNGITVRGQWMYPRWAPGRLVGMIGAGLLDLGHFEAAVFPFERVAEAVSHAAASAGPFRMTVLRP